MSRIIFAIFLLLIGGPLFAQAPLTILGDFNVGNGRINPGVGVSLPMSASTGLIAKANKTAGSMSLVGGFSHAFAHVNKDSVSLIVDLGAAVTTSRAHFVHEYAISYDRWIDRNWTVSPYIKYGSVSGIGGWSAGLVASFRFYR